MFNNISKWVVAMVLQKETSSGRAKFFKKFVQICRVSMLVCWYVCMKLLLLQDCCVVAKMLQALGGIRMTERVRVTSKVTERSKLKV